MNDPLQHALVYQWWPHSLDDRASHNLVSPIIASIATFRKQNPEIAIYVLDYVGGDFADFPDRLGFKVVVRPSYFERTIPRREIKILAHGMAYIGKGPDEEHPFGADFFHLRFCSRPFDIWDFANEIPQRYVTFGDSDLFWFNPLLPFDSDPSRLCIRPDNTGMFYFDKESHDVSAFFELWQTYILMARHEYEFRKKLIELYIAPGYVSEEKILFYMNARIPAALSLLMNQIEPKEMLMSWDYYLRKDIDVNYIMKLKAMHATGTIFGANKGRVPVLFKETYDALRSVFTPEELIDIYGNTVFNNSIYSLKDLGRQIDDPFFIDLKKRVHDDD